MPDISPARQEYRDTGFAVACVVIAWLIGFMSNAPRTSEPVVVPCPVSELRGAI
jgi:hypothetical protein